MTPFYNVIRSFPKKRLFLGKMGTDTLSAAEGTARAKRTSTPLEGGPGTPAGGVSPLEAECDISADSVKSPVEVTWGSG